MDRIKKIITGFEWAYESKPRLFVLGIVIGAYAMYITNAVIKDNQERIIADLRQENKILKEDVIKAQKECMEKLKEVKEFLKYIAS